LTPETERDLLFSSEHLKLFIVTLHVFVAALFPGEEAGRQETRPVGAVHRAQGEDRERRDVQPAQHRPQQPRQGGHGAARGVHGRSGWGQEPEAEAESIDIVAAIALKAPRTVRVAFDYDAGSDTRLLSIFQGETLEITDHAQGWLLAVNERGFAGYIPPTYVDLIS